MVPDFEPGKNAKYPRNTSLCVPSTSQIYPLDSAKIANLILVPPGGAARAYTTVRPSQAVGLSFIWLGGPVRNFAISIHDLFRLVDCISQFAQGPCLSDLPMLQRNDFYLRPVRISSHNQFASYRPKAVGELVIEYPADETSVDVAF